MIEIKILEGITIATVTTRAYFRILEFFIKLIYLPGGSVVTASVVVVMVVPTIVAEMIIYNFCI